MSISKKWILLGLIPVTALVLTACGEKKSKPASAQAPVADTEISLRKESVNADSPTLAAPMYSQKDPGENKKLSRGFYGAPPMIPHKLEDEITADTNTCLDCHEEGDAETPGISVTHKEKAIFASVNYDSAKDGATTYFSGYGKVKKVAGNRYNCQLCHAPQAGNLKPLVENTFTPVTPQQQVKDPIDQLNEVGDY